MKYESGHASGYGYQSQTGDGYMHIGEDIDRFENGYALGCGYGYGDGCGDGSGFGYGSGYGSGDGDGDGYGSA